PANQTVRRRDRLECRKPATFAVGCCRRALIAKLNRDRRVRIRLPPHPDGLIALNDHVVAKHRRDRQGGYYGRCITENQRRCEGGTEKKAAWILDHWTSTVAQPPGK